MKLQGKTLANKTYLANGGWVYSDNIYIVHSNRNVTKVTFRMDLDNRKYLRDITRHLAKIKRSYRDNLVTISFKTIPDDNLVLVLSEIKAIL